MTNLEDLALNAPVPSTGGPPSGSAGGDLTGTYPNPTIGAGKVTAAQLATAVRVGSSQLVYRYTVAGSDKASIDTGADTPDAGTNDWTNGDLLEVYAIIRTDNASADVFPNVVVNNDTGSNYSRQKISGSNTSATAAFAGAEASWTFTAHGSGGSASTPSSLHLTIPNFAGTTFHKAGRLDTATPDATAGNNVVEDWAVRWASTSAITRLKIAAGGTDKLKVGSQLLIYKRLAS